MIFLYALARLHDAIQAVKNSVHRHPEDGSWHFEAGRVRAEWGDDWGLACPWFVLASPDREDPAEEPCEHEQDPDPDAARKEVWVIRPSSIRTLLELVSS